jgi:hypothetical protein
VIDGVGDPHEREHGDEEPERVDDRRARDGGGAEQKAADEVHARVGAVDEEATGVCSTPTPRQMP